MCIQYSPFDSMRSLQTIRIKNKPSNIFQVKTNFIQEVKKKMLWKHHLKNKISKIFTKQFKNHLRR